MADPVNGLLAARMDPERRRRIGNALLAAQFDRETPQDAAVIERAGLFPLGTYANGQTGPAWPGIIATPVEKMAQVLRGEITPGTPEFNEAGFDIAGAAMVGGLAAARPRGSLGMSGRPTEPHPWASLDPPPKPSPFPHGVKREWSPGGETVEIYTAETKPYPMGGHGRMPGSFSDEPLAAGKLELKPRSDGSGEWVWPFTEAEEALVRSYGARGAPDLYANARPGAALGAGLSGASERQGIRAYHGSPHDFDKFDMSKIGTGEGAQAYGHGLYFAENEGVANSYKTSVSAPHRAEPIWQGKRVKEYDYDGNVFFNDGTSIKLADGEINAFHDAMNKPRTPGRMYEVNIKASPDDFLDWDKPLSQQSEKVRGAIEVAGWKGLEAKYSDAQLDKLKVAAEAAHKQYTDMRTAYFADAWKDPSRSEAAFNNLPEVWRAQNEIHKISDKINDAMREREALSGKGILEALSDSPMFGATYDKATANVSAKLREAGIPGIKYLDQGSRSAGEGSRNYVVFDANLIEILRKYGLLGMLGAGGMAQELLKPSKPNIPDDAA